MEIAASLRRCAEPLVQAQKYAEAAAAYCQEAAIYRALVAVRR